MPTEFEDLGMTVYTDGQISCGEKTLRCPKETYYSKRYDESVLIVLHTEGNLESDFEINDRVRSLIRVDASCQLRWISEPAPDEQSHVRVYVVNDRIVTKTSAEGFAEIDPATGKVTDSWSARTFRIDGRTIEFDDPIHHVVEIDGIVVIQTKPSVGTDTYAVYGFDQSGDQRWERSGDGGWLLRDADYLKLEREYPRDNVQIARLDPKTGVIDEIIRGPDSLVES